MRESERGWVRLWVRLGRWRVPLFKGLGAGPGFKRRPYLGMSCGDSGSSDVETGGNPSRGTGGGGRGEAAQSERAAREDLPLIRSERWSYDVVDEDRVIVLLGSPVRSADHIEVITNVPTLLRELSGGR